MSGSESDSSSRAEALESFRRQYDLSDLPNSDLDLALTHRSRAYERALDADNERLEFLGDAILSAVASEYLYQTFPDDQEGNLSKKRGRLVSRALLGQRADELGLGPLLLLGVGEKKGGGEQRRSILGGALEALIGILYLRAGYEAAKKFVLDHVIIPLLPLLEEDSVEGDFKSALQEWTQRVHGSLPLYHRLADSGPDHDKTFWVEVEVKGERIAQGSGPRIKTAENEAARSALENLGQLRAEDSP